ncbi:hypothetical protein H312_03544, partial [Anncaliia algerae PRA339]
KELEDKLIQMNKEETIAFLMNNNYLLKEFKCSFCLEYAIYSKYKKIKTDSHRDALTKNVIIIKNIFHFASIHSLKDSFVIFLLF